MKKTTYYLLPAVFAFVLILSGCNMPKPGQLPGEPTPDLNMILTQIASETQSEPTAEAEPSATETPTSTPEPTATPKKTETLTICLGKEPETLFFYAGSSQAMWSVLESIYDGPFDTGDGKADPVIFEDISIKSEPVIVVRGDIIVDFDGDAVELKQGTVFMPAETKADCIGTDCLSTWSFTSEKAEVLQTVITFRLKEGLIWNDGTPLTAADSVYSMTVNSMKGINASKRIYNLTESYIALDDRTVEWKGLPGYTPDDPSDVFWTPLPGHVMKGMSAQDLLTSEQVNQKPLGWGAWQITSWQKGSEIVAERNPYYTAPNGNEPFFDRIVYKFYGRSGDNSLEAVHSGTCDIIDTSVDLSADLEEILEDTDAGKMAVYIRPELTRQEFVFNLSPIVRQWTIEPLSVPELRIAIAQGINRNAINRQLLFGQSEIPVDFYPADHIGHDSKLTAIAYDPEAAKETLESLGWTVPADDSSGIRTAEKVSGVMYGTKLSIDLYTSDSPFAKQAAGMIREDLAEIGIGVEVNELSLGELYGQGPDGPIFGRKFDTALFAWAAGKDPCSIYLSDQIPSEVNHWVGTNVGGYQNEDFDQACLLPEFSEGNAAQIYAEELPAIPLYFNISIAVSAGNICGISDRIGSRSILWNIEQFSRSETNCAVSQWKDIYQ